MAESSERKHDPNDPRGGRTAPTGPQGADQQETWQTSKSGEEAVREERTKAAGGHSDSDTQEDK